MDSDVCMKGGKTCILLLCIAGAERAAAQGLDAAHGVLCGHLDVFSSNMFSHTRLL